MTALSVSILAHPLDVFDLAILRLIDNKRETNLSMLSLGSEPTITFRIHMSRSQVNRH